jgi:hypothetical protein
LCDGEEHSDNRQSFQHNSEIVPQKYLDRAHLMGYSNYIEVRQARCTGCNYSGVQEP